MLTKTPKSKFFKNIKRGAAIVFVLEAVSFALCYAGYYKLNTERQFRLYMRDSYPSILELYYKTGEILGNNKIREQDNIAWQITGPPTK